MDTTRGEERTYRWSETTPSTAVVETVAAVLDREPTAFDPLFEAVDPEALDAVTLSADGLVSFRYAGCLVTVATTGTVTVEPESD